MALANSLQPTLEVTLVEFKSEYNAKFLMLKMWNKFLNYLYFAIFSSEFMIFVCFEHFFVLSDVNELGDVQCQF